MSPQRRASMSVSRSGQVVEQVIRPTGLLDPEVVVRPVDGQIDDLIGEINARTSQEENGCWSPRSPRKWPRI